MNHVSRAPSEPVFIRAGSTSQLTAESNKDELILYLQFPFNHLFSMHGIVRSKGYFKKTK